MTDRPGLLLEDILAGPAALERLIDAYEDPNGHLSALDPARLAGHRIVLTGLGSSRYAALTAAADLRASGVPAWAEHASTSAGTPPGADVVLIAISASGRTPEVIDAARRHRDSSLVIGVANDPGSPVAGEADIVLPLFAGEERSGVASRTFRATVAVLGLVGDRVVGRKRSPDASRPAVVALAEAIDGRAAWLDDAAELLDGAPAIDVLGDAADIGTISQAALMLREGPRLPAEAHDAGDWLHTAVYLALPGHRAVLFSGTPYDATLVRTIAGRGGKTLVVGTPVEGAALVIGLPRSTPDDTSARGLVRSVVAELLSAELWGRAAATDL